MVDTTSSTISEHGASNPAIDKSHFEEIDTASTTPTPSEVNEPQLETDVPQNSKPKQVTFYDKTVGRFAGLLGFSKRYNAILFFIFGGIMLGFSLSQVEKMVVKEDKLIPGAYFWYRQKLFSFGLTLHVSTCLPAAFLAVFQFVPKIRQKWIMFHRINGYLFYLLMLISMVGAMIITRHSFGGTLTIQAGSGFSALVTVFSAFMAWLNIRRLQIDQHRKWMLRCMVYYSSILSVRILQSLGYAFIISGMIGTYANIWRCDELEFTLNRADEQDKWMNKYAGSCPDFPSGFIAVKCGNDGPEEVASAFRWGFGYALWMSLVLHGIAVETYIRLTPGEDNRLRQVSYERQLEAGNTKNPGNAGTTRDRVGDPLDWQFVPREKKGVPTPSSGKSTTITATTATTTPKDASTSAAERVLRAHGN